MSMRNPVGESRDVRSQEKYASHGLFKISNPFRTRGDVILL